MRATLPVAVHVLGLVALCLTLYLPAAVRTPFFTKGEPREALVVRQMLEHGAWVLPSRPSATGLTIASKPPLFHWLAALGSSLGGHTSELTVRLPSVVLGTATVAAVAVVGATALPARAALMGALVLATTFEWVRAASTARVDCTLAAFTTLGLLIFYRAFLRGSLPLGEGILAYLFLGCASLTKGPVGAVLPILVLMVALLTARRIRDLPQFRPLLGGCILLLVVGGWYAAGWAIGGDAFVQQHILKENVLRFLGTSSMSASHAHPFYYYLPTLAVGLLPWTPFVAGALVVMARNQAARRDPRTRFLLVWFVVVLGFYSLASGKRSVYLLALYAPAALLCGWWLDELAAGVQSTKWLGSRWVRTSAVVLSVVGGALCLVTVAHRMDLVRLDLLEPLFHTRDRANFVTVQEIMKSRFLLCASLLAVVASGLGFVAAALRRRHWIPMFAANTVAAIAIWALVFCLFQPDLGRARTLAPFVTTVARLTNGAPLSFYPPTFDFGAAFYASNPIRPEPPGNTRRSEPSYVLIWDTELAQLPESERRLLTPLATSKGTDPRGKRHMVLARLRSAPEHAAVDSSGLVFAQGVGEHSAGKAPNCGT